MEVGVMTVLYVVLLWLGANPVLAPGAAARNTTSASALEFGKQYLQWEMQHPEANPSKERFSAWPFPPLTLISLPASSFFMERDPPRNPLFFRVSLREKPAKQKANSLRRRLRTPIT